MLLQLIYLEFEKIMISNSCKSDAPSFPFDVFEITQYTGFGKIQ